MLVVDDSATMRRMIMASLRDVRDIAFDQAVSGLEAIERVTLAPVDLVVLDLNMPDVHGLEVLRFIRGHVQVSNEEKELQSFGDELAGPDFKHWEE